MELMHHYTCTSYRTLSKDAAVQKVLQHDLPRLALQNRFLLHQILAFAGYHLAYLHQDHRHSYFLQASRHQNSAIEGLRTALASTVTSQNCHALYAASMLLTISSFASLPSYDRYNGSLDPINSILDIFSIIKGMNMVLHVSDHELRTGPLTALFSQMQEEKPVAEDSDLDLLYSRVERLSTSLAETGFSGSYATHNGPEILQAITSILDCIRQTTAKPSPTSTASLRASFLWPILLTAEYMGSLRERRPAAMVVLAFYCTLLRMAEANCWALECWAELMMESVCSFLNGTRWEKLLEWPKQMVVASKLGFST
jgi:hypothetical protein